jgi:multiple sugar transport system substrate-binding protein
VRRLLACALLIAFTGLAGCVPREDTQVRLRVSFWSPPGIEEEVARRFEAAHPGVKVDLLITGGRYFEKLQSMIVAGNEPDVLMVHDTFFHEWAARAVFTDLTDFVQELHREDPYMTTPLETFEWNGRNYALPLATNAMVTYGNLEALAQAGHTFPWSTLNWHDLEQLGPRLSRYGGNPSSPTEYLCAMPQEWFFLIAYGARCFDDLHHPREVVVESETTIAAFEFWRRMHQRGWAVPRSTVLDQGESEMFRDGRIAMLFEGRASSRIIMGNTGLSWDIAPLPVGPAGRPAVPHISSGVAISRRSKHPELARAYLRFYASDAGMEVPIERGVMAPTRRRQALGEMFLSRTPPASMRPYVEPVESGQITAMAYAPGRLEAAEIVRNRFEQSLAEPALSTAQIVAALGADLREWLKRMQEKGLL